ncbi:MAG: translocation/assembly module TamB domain-containing protein [Deltaproteobacteria bacterium]|nr:translocation/assembly module TamB domain-containing protein [Deltaproteobacteria bacterium]
MIRKLAILLFLGAILSAAAGVVMLADTPEGKAVIISLVQDELERATGLRVGIGDVEVHPWLSEVELLDVRVDGNGAPRLAGAASVRVSLAPLQLLSGTVVVAALEVGDPYVNLTIRDGWMVGVPRPPPRDGPAEPLSEDLFFRFYVEHFAMSGLDVRVKVDAKHPFDIRLRGARAVLHARDMETHEGVFALEDGTIDLPTGRQAHLDGVDGRAVLHGEGLLRPEQLDIDGARLALDDIRGTLHGAVRFAPLHTGLIPAADLAIAAYIPLTVVNAWVPDLVPVRGTVEFNANLRSAFGARHPTLTGAGELKGITMNDFVIGNWAGAFVADLTGVDFTDVRSDFASGDIRGAGRVEFGDEVTAHFQAQGSHASFAAGMANIRIPGSWVDFNIDATVDFRGTLYPKVFFTGVGDALCTNFRVYSQDAAVAPPEDLVMALAPVTGHSRMEFDLEHFSFLQGMLTDGKTTVHGDVFLPYLPDNEFWVEGRADPAEGGMADCETFSPIGPVHLTCRGPGKVHVRGLYWDPHVWAEAKVNNVSIEGYHLGDAEGRVDYRNLLVKFIDVKGKKQETVWEGRADLNWRAYLGQGPDGKPLKRPRTKRDTLFVDVAARNITGRAEDIRAIIPPGWGEVMEYLRTVPVNGWVSGWADARGAVGDGTVEDLTFETEFNVGAVDLYGQAFDGHHVSAHMDRQRVYFDDVDLRRAGSSWRTAGWIARKDGAVKLDVAIRDMPVAHLDALSDVPMALAGTFDVDANVRGAIGDWQGPVRLDVREVAVGDIPVGTGGLDLVMGGGRIRGTGPIFDGRAALDWNMKLEPPWQFSADGRVERGPAQDLIGRDTLPRLLSLTFGGRVHAEGALSEASRTRGQVTLTQVALGYNRLAAHSDGDVRFRFAGDRVTLQQLALTTDEGARLDARGGVQGSNLDLDLELAGDLSSSRLFVDSVREAYGPLTLKLTVSGTASQPVLVGQGRLSGGLLVVEGFPHKFRNLDTSISFLRDRVVLDPLVCTLDDSPVRGHADVALNGFSLGNITLTARFQDLRFRVPDYLPSRLSGAITMTGTSNDMLLVGDVDVLEARYTDAWEWERIGVELRRRRLAPKVFAKDKEWLSFDVHLRADDKIFVKNDQMDAEFRGDLHLTGSNERPGLIGTLTALGGQAWYRNNQFELGRTSADFTERTRIAVNVDVEARSRIKGYDVWVEVQGPVEQLSAERGIRMWSRPDLPAVDVLSLVLFGFTQGDVNQGTSASGAVAMAGGLDFVTRATGVDKEVRRALPKQVVDEFYLTSRTPRRASGAAQGSVPALVVGTELWPGTRLRLTSTILDPSGNTNDQSVELEKRWSEHFSGRLVWDRASSLQQYGDAGGDLRYRWEF